MLKRRLNLDANEVALIVNTMVLAFTKPAWPDDCEQGIALTELLFDVLAKIDTEWNAVDTHKYTLVAVMPGEYIEYSASCSLAIGPTIREKNLHLSRS